MRLWLIVSGCIALVLAMALPAPAQAHVFITDDTGAIGAVLHITPDDDPVAGKPSKLAYDIQDSTFSRHLHELRLQVENGDGTTEHVPLTVNGSVVTAQYAFPTRGTYRITLSAKALNVPKAHTHSFVHAQRVSRGATGSPLGTPSHAWAEVLLVASGCAFAVLCIVAYNRRREIAANASKS